MSRRLRPFWSTNSPAEVFVAHPSAELSQFGQFPADPVRLGRGGAALAGRLLGPSAVIRGYARGVRGRDAGCRDPDRPDLRDARRPAALAPAAAGLPDFGRAGEARPL